MATRTLDVGRREAGADYLAAVERLGLRPTALFWAFDNTIEQFALVLTTPMFDYAGPFELSKVLVEAYRRSGTPKEVDPFVVRTHSPNHAIIREMGKFMPFKISVQRDGQDVKDAVIATVKTGDLELNTDWVYRFDTPSPLKTVDAGRRWQRFVKNVDRLAA